MRPQQMTREERKIAALMAQFERMEEKTRSKDDAIRPKEERPLVQSEVVARDTPKPKGRQYNYGGNYADIDATTVTVIVIVDDSGGGG